MQILNSLIFFELYGDTLKLTNLGERKQGDLINIEVEPMLKKIGSPKEVRMNCNDV